MFNVREEENYVYTFKEAFIPQLTLTNSEKLFWFLLCSAVEFPADGDVFKPPSPATDPSIGGRQWSSLKSSASPAAAERGDSRERAKSLPAHGAIFNIISITCCSVTVTNSRKCKENMQKQKKCLRKSICGCLGPGPVSDLNVFVLCCVIF